MFRRFQATLLTLAKEWRDPDLAQQQPPVSLEGAVGSTA
jgi:hypothetical protein